VNIGSSVTFHSTSHKIGKVNRRAGDLKTKGITVGDGAWISSNTMINPGVNIGKGALIMPNSVVMGDVGDNEVWGGNPAVRIKKFRKDLVFEEDEVEAKQDAKEKTFNRDYGTLSVERNF